MIVIIIIIIINSLFLVDKLKYISTYNTKIKNNKVAKNKMLIYVNYSIN